MKQKKNPFADGGNGLWLSLISLIQEKRYSGFFLVLAISFEVAGITYMYLSNSYTKVISSVLYFIFFLISILLLPPISWALKTGIVYVIWSGLGSMATVLIGRLLANESIKPLQVVGMILIIVGILIIGWSEKTNLKRISSLNPKSPYDRLKVSPSPMLMQNSPKPYGSESRGWWATYVHLSHTRPWAWLMLLLAIAMEVAGTTCMRLSNSYTKVVPSVLYFVFYAVSSILLPPVAEGLGIGMVYVIWSGVGSLAAVLLGRFVFDEVIDVYKGVGMGIVVIGALAMSWGDEEEGGVTATPFIISPAGLVSKGAPSKKVDDELRELLHGTSR